MFVDVWMAAGQRRGPRSGCGADLRPAGGGGVWQHERKLLMEMPAGQQAVSIVQGVFLDCGVRRGVLVDFVVKLEGLGGLGLVWRV